MTTHVELLELYKRANDDYLCSLPLTRSLRAFPLLTPAVFAAIPLLISYTQHFISHYYAAQGISPPPAAVEDEDEVMEDVKRKIGDEDVVLGAVFDLDAAREVRNEVLAIGGGHLAEVSFVESVNVPC